MALTASSHPSPFSFFVRIKLYWKCVAHVLEDRLRCKLALSGGLSVTVGSSAESSFFVLGISDMADAFESCRGLSAIHTLNEHSSSRSINSHGHTYTYARTRCIGNTQQQGPVADLHIFVSYFLSFSLGLAPGKLWTNQELSLSISLPNLSSNDVVRLHQIHRLFYWSYTCTSTCDLPNKSYYKR